MPTRRADLGGASRYRLPGDVGEVTGDWSGRINWLRRWRQPGPGVHYLHDRAGWLFRLAAQPDDQRAEGRC